jgi:transposase-like protein
MRTPSSTTSTKADDFRRIEVITGVGRRRRWTDEEKAWIVAESLDPATTVSAVAWRFESALPLAYPNWTELAATGGLFALVTAGLMARAAWGG